MTKERPLTDPVDVLSAIREQQPGKAVNVPGHIVDAVLALCKNARRDADELLSLDVYDLAPLETDRTQKDQDTNVDLDVDLTGLELDPQSSDEARDDQLFEKIYESVRGEAGKQGVRQKSTEEILAEIDKKK